ncbi:MAG: hypothetical protein ABW215_09855 [Kibdelosporangium sp.]
MNETQQAGPRVPVVPTALGPVHESWLPKEHSLYRPRHSGSQLTAKICAMVFLFLPLVLLIVGVRPQEIENRRLASFPSLGDGWAFFTGLNGWATDHLPLRGEAIDVEDGISRGIFGEPPKLGEQGTTQPGTPPGPVQGPAVAPGAGDKDRERMRASLFPRVVEGKNGWMYAGYDILGACLPDRPLNEVITGLQRLRTAVERSGRKFVLVVAPDKTTMVPENLPSSFVGSACSTQARLNFWRRVIREAGAVDLRPELQKAAERRGGPVYSNVDTHWTYEGGVVMSRAIADKLQPGVTSTWRVTPGSVTSRAGDLPPLIGRTGEVTVQNFDLAPDGRTIRSRPLAGDFLQPLRLGQTQATGAVDANIGMVADSFSLYAAPYLAGGFSDLTIVHVDTLANDPQKVASMLADKEVVVLESAERSLLGGISQLVTDKSLTAIEAELARRPRG